MVVLILWVMNYLLVCWNVSSYLDCLIETIHSCNFRRGRWSQRNKPSCGLTYYRRLMVTSWHVITSNFTLNRQTKGRSRLSTCLYFSPSRHICRPATTMLFYCSPARPGFCFIFVFSLQTRWPAGDPSTGLRSGTAMSYVCGKSKS